MRCESCGFANPEGMKFCGQCAVPLKSHCPQCGFANPPGFKFCGECAAPLAGQPARPQSSVVAPQPLAPTRAEAERRQLTVMFIDLVGSTTLSQQLDPEDYHARVVAYQTACHQVIARYEGHIAQYLGDGVLVYFGYPTAHEDDAVRAVRSGLEIITAVSQLQYTPPLQVRIGIHTGPVVVGEIGAGERTERLALGETPNIAARVQGTANPDEVLISAATYRLIEGLFACEERGQPDLKGVATPLTLYRVVNESDIHSRFEAARQKGLTPLVGREEELALLHRRWEQAKASAGQVVLLSGEAGMGKSRLVQEMKDRVSAEGATRIEFRCSPYHQNSAFYPIIDHLQRLLQFTREDAPEAKLKKLEDARAGAYGHTPLQSDAVPLLAALLSLPHPDGYPPITVSSQKQKERTQAALVAWLTEDAEQAAVFCTWEDLHWADPTTLEVITLLLDHVPTTRLLMLLTFRPEFTSPWGNRSHLSHMMLSRLGRPHVETMIEQVTHGKRLPSEAVQQIVSKTDGIPLFVEELTKTVVESGLLRAEGDRYIGAHGDASIPPLAIPATLQDSLMARLDRLAPVKEIAQLGATIGREFSYELLHAVSPVDERTLQQGLRQLVEVELLYQRGLPPHATYLFKHALIQDTAYQSLLKSKRQQYHQQIASVLEAQFPDTTETQPELLAHHYTEANLITQAIPYWQKAGQGAAERSAHVEAISHLSKGLELLTTLPDTPEHVQQELTLQLTLGASQIIIKGYAAREVEHTYRRARELCRQVGETPQLFTVLGGLWQLYLNRAEFQTVCDLGEELLFLTQNSHAPDVILMAHNALGQALHWLGEFVQSQTHVEQVINAYGPQDHRSLTFLCAGEDPGVVCLTYMARNLWLLGYAEQALSKAQQALALAREVASPFDLSIALWGAAILHQWRGDRQQVQERTEAMARLSIEQGFSFWLAHGTILRGWALAEQGQVEEGIAQMQQGLAACRATGTEVVPMRYLPWLAAAYAKVGQAEQGLTVLAEVSALMDKTGARLNEAELYRLKGTLMLQQESKEQGAGSNRGKESEVRSEEHNAENPNPNSQILDPHGEAEACFHKAIEVAKRQQAKSLELRATVSLARLWQQQGKRREGHQMLSEVYGWFTEGFDTKDLQEAKALLDELSEREADMRG